MTRGAWIALAAGAVLSALPAAAGAYRTGPPAGHTGGLGEPTCAACHWSEDEEVGTGLSLQVPRTYQPGETYDIVVELRDTALVVAGFQLSSRFDDGASAGGQAGTLAAPDSAVAVITSGAGIEYASHTARGSTPEAPGRARWVVRWTAPAADATVVFNAAANAANDDISEYGDRIHAAEARSRPLTKEEDRANFRGSRARTQTTSEPWPRR